MTLNTVTKTQVVVAASWTVVGTLFALALVILLTDAFTPVSAAFLVASLLLGNVVANVQRELNPNKAATDV